MLETLCSHPVTFISQAIAHYFTYSRLLKEQSLVCFVFSFLSWKILRYWYCPCPNALLHSKCMLVSILEHSLFSQYSNVNCLKLFHIVGSGIQTGNICYQPSTLTTRLNATPYLRTKIFEINCRPHYLPREFSAILSVAVYLSPQTDAGTKTALSQLYKGISKQETTHTEAALLVAGDFNAGKLKSVLPNLYQHVKCATRAGNNSRSPVLHTQRRVQCSPSLSIW